MQFVSWDKRFVDPIAVPGRKPLVTLRDAATYITKLPHGRTRCRRMAGRDGSAVAGRRTRRATVVRAHRYHESDQPARRARKTSIGGSGSSRGTNDDRLDLRRYQMAGHPAHLKVFANPIAADEW